MKEVHKNIESQRRQYPPADRARELGWQDMEVIDDDLGRPGTGIKRPGFKHLLNALCDDQVGAVLCDRGRESVMLPLPPNRTGGSTAYDSPVGGFTWSRIGELHHHLKEIPLTGNRDVFCPFLP